MRIVSSNYTSKILQRRRFAIGELYSFELVDGSIDRFTDLDFHVNVAGDGFYRGNTLIIEGLRFKTSVGWNVDEQDVRVISKPEDTLAGSSFIEAATAGLLDGATLTRKRAFWEAPEGPALDAYRVPPVEVVTLFIGRISTVEKIGRTAIEMKVRSPLAILDMDMPRNTYQPGCQWDLFDPGCTLNRADWTFNGEVENAYTTGVQVVGGIPNPTGADGDAYFAQGRLQFTSGARQNLMLTIRTNDASVIFFMFPPVTGLSAGDTFLAWPGCSKRHGTCSSKFNNIHNFRGFPRVPPIIVSA